MKKIKRIEKPFIEQGIVIIGKITNGGGTLTDDELSACKEKFQKAYDYLTVGYPDYDIINPFDFVPADATHAEAMTITCGLILKHSHIYCLLDYEQSKGAMFEYALANITGKTIEYQSENKKNKETE
jgi:hypothetical protein